MRVHADQLVGERPQADQGQDHGGDDALVQRAHDVLGSAEADEESADDRGDDAHAGNGQRIEHQGGLVGAGEVDRGQNHGGDRGHREGFEQIGRHAGAVADIVADIVGDGGRVARVIFGNTRFDLADHVAADVSALGEDAAAETGEDRDQRSAEGKTDQRVHDDAALRRIIQAEAEAHGQDGVIAGHCQQAQAHHQHAGNGAGAERHRQAGGQAGARRFGGAHIGAHRNEHADITGQARQDRADQEADAKLPAEKPAGEHEDHHADHGDGGVLAIEIGARAFLNGGGDFLHPGIAGGQAENRADRPGAIQQRKHAAQQDDEQFGIHDLSLVELK